MSNPAINPSQRPAIIKCEQVQIGNPVTNKFEAVWLDEHDQVRVITQYQWNIFQEQIGLIMAHKKGQITGKYNIKYHDEKTGILKIMVITISKPKKLPSTPTTPQSSNNAYPTQEEVAAARQAVKALGPDAARQAVKALKPDEVSNAIAAALAAGCVGAGGVAAGGAARHPSSAYGAGGVGAGGVGAGDVEAQYEARKAHKKYPESARYPGTPDTRAAAKTALDLIINNRDLYGHTDVVPHIESLAKDHPNVAVLPMSALSPDVTKQVELGSAHQQAALLENIDFIMSKIDCRGKEFIAFPLHDGGGLGGHWTFVYVDIANGTIWHLDSFAHEPPECLTEGLVSILQRKFNKHFHVEKGITDPLQIGDSVMCGAWTIAFATWLIERGTASIPLAIAALVATARRSAGPTAPKKEAFRAFIQYFRTSSEQERARVEYYRKMNMSEREKRIEQINREIYHANEKIAVYKEQIGKKNNVEKFLGMIKIQEERIIDLRLQLQQAQAQQADVVGQQPVPQGPAQPIASAPPADYQEESAAADAEAACIIS